MKTSLTLIFALLVPILAWAQIQSLEMTGTWQKQTESLVHEDGQIPAPPSNRRTEILSRFRLLGLRSRPVLELRGTYTDPNQGDNLSDLRIAGFVPLPMKGTFLKAIFIEGNPESGAPTQESAGYLIGGFSKLRTAIGLDYSDDQGQVNKILSARVKYQLSSLSLMGGYSHEPDDIDRFSVGAVLELPLQLMIGGLAGIWENDHGFAVNVGRYNKPGDFQALPSMALNYLEVPQTYKWLNFRLMWGARGLHYVRPTFDNGVFSGMVDLDLALMLKQLIRDNYRHFDSPLLFKRYDEYGTVALRINYLDTQTTFRKFDANISWNTGLDLGPLKALNGVLTFERIHHPAFKWQKDRYHLNLGCYPFTNSYLGITQSSDFESFSQTLVEFRVFAEAK